jgi:hypothetical protein
MGEGRKPRMWSFDERVFLCLYGGVAFPVLYLVILIVLFGVFGAHLADGVKLSLIFPLSWPSTIVENVYRPRIEAVGDVFEAAALELVAAVLMNFVFYSSLVFITLTVVNHLRRRGASAAASSA